METAWYIPTVTAVWLDGIVYTVGLVRYSRLTRLVICVPGGVAAGDNRGKRRKRVPAISPGRTARDPRFGRRHMRLPASTFHCPGGLFLLGVR